MLRPGRSYSMFICDWVSLSAAPELFCQCVQVSYYCCREVMYRRRMMLSQTKRTGGALALGIVGSNPAELHTPY